MSKINLLLLTFRRKFFVSYHLINFSRLTIAVWGLRMTIVVRLNIQEKTTIISSEEITKNEKNIIALFWRLQRRLQSLKLHICVSKRYVIFHTHYTLVDSSVRRAFVKMLFSSIRILLVCLKSSFESVTRLFPSRRNKKNNF